MTVLGDRLAEYLHVRRQLGFKLEPDGDLLADFVAFLHAEGAERVTVDLSVRWARGPGVSGRWQMARLSMVRGFARYLATLDPATEIPPDDLLHARQTRNPPYVYCEREISELIAAAAALRGATYRTVIGTMATSGTRIGETLALDRDDVDLEQGVLHIRTAKGDATATCPCTRAPPRCCAVTPDCVIGPARGPTRRRSSSARPARRSPAAGSTRRFAR
jgi:integrase